MNAPMNGLPDIEPHRDGLDFSLTRFYVAKGLSDVDTSGELLVPLAMTARDRSTHTDLLAAGSICDSDIVEFMHRVSGLSRALCATWNYLDNIALCEQGAQPEWVLGECYAETVEIVKGDYE